MSPAENKGVKFLRYETAAIEDYKAGDISIGRLFEICLVPYQQAYRKLLDEEKAKGLDGFDGIDTERIAGILSSCDMRRCDKYIIIPHEEKEAAEGG